MGFTIFLDLDLVDADVDDHAARLEHIAGNQARFADGHKHGLGLAGVVGQVARAVVTDGDRGQLLQQMQGHRFAHDFGVADDDHVQPLQGQPRRAQQLDRGQRGTRSQDKIAVDDFADVGGVHAFDILGRVDRHLDLFQAEVGRHGPLEDDTGDAGIDIEGVDDGQDFLLGDVGRVLAMLELDADFFRNAPLVADVQRHRRVLADFDGGQPGLPADLFQIFNSGLDLAQDRFSDFFAADDFVGHRF